MFDHKVAPHVLRRAQRRGYSAQYLVGLRSWYDAGIWQRGSELAAAKFAHTDEARLAVSGILASFLDYAQNCVEPGQVTPKGQPVVTIGGFGKIFNIRSESTWVYRVAGDIGLERLPKPQYSDQARYAFDPELIVNGFWRLPNELSQAGAMPSDFLPPMPPTEPTSQ
jgi:hypothetical protein